METDWDNAMIISMFCAKDKTIVASLESIVSKNCQVKLFLADNAFFRFESGRPLNFDRLNGKWRKIDEFHIKNGEVGS